MNRIILGFLSFLLFCTASLLCLNQISQGDAYTYVQNGTLIESYVAIPTAFGTTNLTYQSPTNVEMTGSMSQNVVLPSALSMPIGRRFNIQNSAAGQVVIEDNGTTPLVALPPNAAASFVLTTRSTAAGTWQYTPLPTLNGLYTVSQSFATDELGTNFGIASLGSTHTFSLPVASSVNTGKLASADWITFNAKQSTAFTPLVPGDWVSPSPSPTTIENAINALAAGKLNLHGKADTAGAADTATALSSDPSPCPSGQYVYDADANGALHCSVPPGGDASAVTYTPSDYGNWPSPSPTPSQAAQALDLLAATMQTKQNTLTFAQSVQNSAGTVTLVNDSASPGNSRYYGTNASGTKGYYPVPTASSAPSGSGGNLLAQIEEMGYLSKVGRYVPACSIQDYILEPFVRSDFGRIALVNTQWNWPTQNVSLSGSNLTGTVENEIYAQKDHASTNFDWSTRFNTNTVFVVDAGSSSTVTKLQSGTTDRSAEISGGSHGWFVQLARSVSTVAFQQSNGAYRVTVTAPSPSPSPVAGGYNIYLTHSDIGVTLPAPSPSPSPLTEWVYVHESTDPVQYSINGGAYTTMTPSKIIVGEPALPYPSGVVGHWRLGSNQSIEPNYATPTEFLSATGTGGASGGGLFGTARGPFSSGNYLRWSTALSTTNYDDTGNSMAWGVWFKTSVTGATQYIANKWAGTNYGWALAVHTDNKVYLYLGNGGGLPSAGSSSTVTDGNWHYFYVAHLGSGTNQLVSYTDGVATGMTTAGSAPTGAPLTIGIGSDGVSSPFQGQLGELEIWKPGPADSTAAAAIASQRWNNGKGITYGSYAGYVVSGQVPAQSVSAGQKLGVKTTITRALTTIYNFVEQVVAYFE